MTTLPEYMIGNTRNGLIHQIKLYEQELSHHLRAVEKKIAALREALLQFPEPEEEK